MNGCRVNWLGVIRREKGYANGLSLVNGSSEYFVGLKANFDKKNDSGEPEPLGLYKVINWLSEKRESRLFIDYLPFHTEAVQDFTSDMICHSDQGGMTKFHLTAYFFVNPERLP